MSPCQENAILLPSGEGAGYRGITGVTASVVPANRQEAVTRTTLRIEPPTGGQRPPKSVPPTRTVCDAACEERPEADDRTGEHAVALPAQRVLDAQVGVVAGGPFP